MNRAFLLPTVFSVTALSACGDSIVGDWDLQSVTYDGMRYDYPVTSTENDGEYVITYTYAGALSADSDGEVVFTQMYTYSSTDGTNYTENYSYVGTWTKGDGGSFELDFEDDDLDMNCTIEDGDLECETADFSVIFGAAE